MVCAGCALIFVVGGTAASAPSFDRGRRVPSGSGVPMPIGGGTTSTRVAGRGDAPDNAAGANRSATTMAVVREARRDRVDVERSGARMTGAEETREEGALASDNFRAEPG